MSTVSSTSTASRYYAIPTAASTLPKQLSTGALLLQAQAAANSSDTVNLSSAAQLYLQQKAGSTQGTGDKGFTLSVSQQQKISSIVAQYKDAPLTQDTFNQLQDALKQAGLSPDHLSGQDRAQSFNPELEFLNASNGIASALPSATAEQAKSVAYVNHLYDQLKAVSTAVSA